MTGRDRLKTAMLGGKPDRVPFMPQICFPHAVRQIEENYEQGIIRCVEDVDYRMELMFEITKQYHSDGFRIQGVDSRPLRVVRESGLPIVYQAETGEMIGKLNFSTGGIESTLYPVHSMEDAAQIPVPSIDNLIETKEFKLFKTACAWAPDLNKVGSLAVGISWLVQARGTEQAFFDLYDNPDLVDLILSRSLEAAIVRAKAMHQCGFDTLYIGDPWSSCSVMSPEIFERFAFPCFKQFVEAVRVLEMPVYAHICGNVAPILERIVNTGVHCIEPMDPLGGLSAADYRERVQQRVALMGGVNTVTLSTGTPDQVREEAQACITGAGLDGAYILAAGDMVPTETPRENVLAMWDVALRNSY
ncbi:MAG: hypothetical protein GXY22_02485 [Clostridiaceae bacterium]|jgi:hypothetical protein|nr:hypothetical protein [Clostridiaceae bacterium]